MKYYTSNKAICPFYKHENRFVIFCQGVEDESVIHLAFPKPSSCYQFKEKYCRKQHDMCPIAQMLSDMPNSININTT